jgi:hypothetical protein
VVLVTLGTTVTAFHTAAFALRSAQNTIKTNVDNARTDLEGMCKLCAASIYGMIGLGQWVFRRTPELVDTLWDVNILRQPAQVVPGAPTDTQWTPANFTLASTAMPDGGTRFEA